MVHRPGGARMSDGSFDTGATAVDLARPHVRQLEHRRRYAARLHGHEQLLNSLPCVRLASRARRRVRGASTPDADRTRHRHIVEAFLAASRAGDFDALVALLDPDIVFRTDAQGVRMHAPSELRGAEAVAGMFKGRALAAVPGFIDGEVGVLVPVKGRMLLVFDLRFGDGRITSIEVIAEREVLAGLALTSIDGGDPLAAS